MLLVDRIGSSNEPPITKFCIVQKRITEEDVNEERNGRELFRKRAGEDLELDAYELRGLLNGLYARGRRTHTDRQTQIDRLRLWYQILNKNGSI